MPNPSTSGTPGGTTDPWMPSKHSFQYIARYPEVKPADYVTDEAELLHDIRNLLINIHNALTFLVHKS